MYRECDASMMDDHDPRLAHDPKTIALLTSRRRALRWFANTGGATVLASSEEGSRDTRKGGPVSLSAKPTAVRGIAR